MTDLVRSGLAALALVLLPSHAVIESEESVVIETVQRFFDAMAARDTSAMRAVILPEGRIFSIREEGAQVVVGGSTQAEFLERLADTEDDLLERMWDPQVFIHDRIAMLWTRYDFQRNGEFSHCGVDSFSLLETSDGWKIAGIIYTVERRGCYDEQRGHGA